MMAPTTTPATQALLPVTQADRERAADIAENLAINSDLFPALIRNGQHDKHPFVQSYARHRKAHSLPGDVGKLNPDDAVERSVAAYRAVNASTKAETRESDKPPAHWTPDVMSSRGIETAEEWDWRRDGPENDPLNRSWNRLRFAYVYADPHAPDQMALVLRIDLGRILSRLTRALAQIEMKDEQIAALPSHQGAGE